MHIFISGATGRNGRLALDNALSRGHTITVLTRNPSSLPSNPNLTVIKGSPSSPQDVQTALSTPTPPSAILLTLNQRRTSENPFSPLSPDSPPDLLATTTSVLLAAIAATPFARPPKIIVNSLFGARDSWQNLSWPFRAVMSHSTMKIAVKDHNNMDTLIRDSGVPFVFARPARLTEGPAAEVKVWPDDGQGCGWNVVISRESLAAWMVRAAESDEWDGKSPVLTN
ncbi:uncharacterized protein TRIVIDRAFT_69527 [Trichoderma virens Gv29-8]|uniref:NAD(P)-binding domain-containing protein n=1 Tax=Hypocrea virens (strain Gv29-8 / FGSC 10586) TaxID=413071 RepID=G9MGG0_HYPVG|nr:uncharacterized protein TRIVIDRAFT_69527 [Trichoderma virens Gv29-8]EHK26608.1 hypothetical protein TRIVIDRAFT_69527 [Trichoderma virens Gv29-8]UKZ46781.1 hypothetical protein TrVGV298_000991 [Trichoderma virens]